MKRLMEQLSSGYKVPQKRTTDVQEAPTKAVACCKTLQPMPEHERLVKAPMSIEADPERLITVSIADSGEGMSPEFIHERLCRLRSVRRFSCDCPRMTRRVFIFCELAHRWRREPVR